LTEIAEINKDISNATKFINDAANNIEKKRKEISRHRE
jgi:hypothetical protein